MNLCDFLTETADRYGNRPAVTDLRSGQSITYAALRTQVDAIGAVLRAAGVGAPQRIGLVAGDGLAYIPAAFAVLATGACMVPIAPTLRPVEQAAIIAQTDVNALVRLDASGTPVLEWVARDRPPAAGFAELSAAFIRFSSGTTADAKGVILSHRAVAARVAAADAVLHLSPDDVVLWVLPLAYHFAVTITAYVRAGAHMLLAGEVAPARLAATAETTAASVLYGSPIHFERMANTAGATRLPALRLAVSTAAALPNAVAERFANVFDHPLGQTYGIIEAGLPCINTGDGPLGSVGRPVPGYEVALRDNGEVVVRGPGLFDGYYAPRQTRAQVTTDGWFHTGDIGTLDANGALTLRGRTKSTIIVAGMKLFPEEVEACLNALPGVRESRVFGHPHPRLGEIPIAEVVAADGPTPNPAALAAALAQSLSSYKLPVEIRLVDAIPKTAGGKVLRRPI